MNKYGNELKEAYVILNTLTDEDYNKIPKSKLQLIEANMNDDYEYEINEEIALEENPMLDGTRALLYNIFRDYLATEEQRKKIKKMQAEDRAKLENKKRELYDVNIFKKFDNENDKKTTVENKQMIEYKENIFTKILNGIKNIFKH